MSNGLYYYKLVSGYPDDVTKNCKLTINEIDSNFFNLKSYDIETIEFVRESKMLVITRINGDKQYVDLSSITYDLSIDTEAGESGSTTLSFTYDVADGTHNVKLENVITTDNVLEFIKREGKVITDGTIVGNGNITSPIGIKRTEETGMISPTIALIDVTNGESLPLEAKLGARYLTKEYIDDYGYLYNGVGISKISEFLEEDGRGWRVPTKADWDALLNSMEPCEYKNHDSLSCYVELGKYAGKFMKSECGWVGQLDCNCDNTASLTACSFSDGSELESGNSELICCGCVHSSGSSTAPSEKAECPCGVDSYGFTVLPSGVGVLDGQGNPKTVGFKEKSIFWTSTFANEESEEYVFVKEFDYDRSGVMQATECMVPYYSLRLVKDYDGNNYFGAEYIDGVVYNAILRPESGQIWLASNYASTANLDNTCDEEHKPDYVDVNNGETERRKQLFLNVWNGNYWEKKLLREGDTVVINNPIAVSGDEKTIEVVWTDGEGIEHSVEVTIPIVPQENAEYRVFTNEENCDKELFNTDDLVIERVLNVIIPILEAEVEDRTRAIEELNEKIDNEISARTEADNELRDSIAEEMNQRTLADSELWDALVEETSARTEADESLLEALNDEVSARTEADAQISEDLAAEVARAQGVEEQLWEAISASSEADERIWEAINAEIERATEREDEIDGQLINHEIDYTISPNEGLTLELKNGGLINISFDGDFGQI